ncbi:MAG: right-handed parallel beta-helix repeat-containing protein [Chitinophagaceae bacterium]|nr:right-handed parallel beta-helix repeat-containing protein [Chitinophagaceae bacterium]
MKYLVLIILLTSGNSFSQSAEYKPDALVKVRKKPRLITIGGATADIQGFTNESIQMGVDALPPEGGMVKLNAGVFSIKSPVRLSSNVSLIGSGRETILKRIDGFRSRFIVDADYGELKLTVENVRGFEVGMSVQVKDDINSSCWDVSTAEITDIVDNVLYIDKYLIRDYESAKNGWVTNAGSCILVENAENVRISHLSIEGNKSNNDLLDGCVGGGIAILKSINVTVDSVQVNNFNGEGITWQITENVTVRNSEINGCTNMGLHPGSGSPNTLIENNIVHNNKTGLFLCWRVQNSVIRSNKFYNNLEYGISTGHKDSDVMFESNVVSENGKCGVRFRNEDEKNSPHRTTFVKNTVENNGSGTEGYGFIIEGKSQNVVLRENKISCTRKGTQRTGVFMGEHTTPVKLENNSFSGHTAGNVIYSNE